MSLVNPLRGMSPLRSTSRSSASLGSAQSFAREHADSVELTVASCCESKAELNAGKVSLNLAGQLRVGLCLALSVIGAAAAVMPRTCEAGQKTELAQVLVQKKSLQESAGSPQTLTEGWLMAKDTLTQPDTQVLSGESIHDLPMFEPSSPVALKGDYVAHGVNFSVLLTDQEFGDTQAASSQDIQNLLDEKDSFLAGFQIDSLRASDLIVKVAEEEGINPWLVVTTLEKENSMVSRHKEPKNGVMQAAMGYGHTDGGKKTGHNNSFENQIRRGAALLKELFQEGQQQEFPKAMKVDFGKRTVRVRNAATYALMRYTPHTVDTSLGKVGGGNYLFRNILEDFTQQVAQLREQLLQK